MYDIPGVLLVYKKGGPHGSDNLRFHKRDRRLAGFSRGLGPILRCCNWREPPPVFRNFKRQPWVYSLSSPLYGLPGFAEGGRETTHFVVELVASVGRNPMLHRCGELTDSQFGTSERGVILPPRGCFQEDCPDKGIVASLGLR